MPAPPPTWIAWQCEAHHCVGNTPHGCTACVVERVAMLEGLLAQARDLLAFVPSLGARYDLIPAIDAAIGPAVSRDTLTPVHHLYPQEGPVYGQEGQPPTPAAG